MWTGAVAVGLTWSGSAPGQVPGPAARPAQVAPDGSQADVSVTTHTPGQTERRLRVLRVTTENGEPVAEVQDVGGGPVEKIPVRDLLGKSEPSGDLPISHKTEWHEAPCPPAGHTTAAQAEIGSAPPALSAPRRIIFPENPLVKLATRIGEQSPPTLDPPPAKTIVVAAVDSTPPAAPGGPAEPGRLVFADQPLVVPQTIVPPNPPAPPVPAANTPGSRPDLPAVDAKGWPVLTAQAPATSADGKATPAPRNPWQGIPSPAEIRALTKPSASTTSNPIPKPPVNARVINAQYLVTRPEAGGQIIPVRAVAAAPPAPAPGSFEAQPTLVKYLTAEYTRVAGPYMQPSAAQLAAQPTQAKCSVQNVSPAPGSFEAQPTLVKYLTAEYTRAAGPYLQPSAAQLTQAKCSVQNVSPAPGSFEAQPTLVKYLAGGTAQPMPAGSRVSGNAPGPARDNYAAAFAAQPTLLKSWSQLFSRSPATSSTSVPVVGGTQTPPRAMPAPAAPMPMPPVATAPQPPAPMPATITPRPAPQATIPPPDIPPATLPPDAPTELPPIDAVKPAPAEPKKPKAGPKKEPPDTIPPAVGVIAPAGASYAAAARPSQRLRYLTVGGARPMDVAHAATRVSVEPPDTILRVALGAMSSPMVDEVGPFATELFTALRPTIRERAATALAEGRYGWKPEIKALLAKAAQTDPAPTVRAHCIHALSKLGYHETKYLEYLEESAVKDEQMVRQASHLALAKLEN
ncbi:Outer membrane protein, OmpA/MotB family [Fimbriiglobus ruber]|uniref:Outer membrane protein, OmpA/MotB family n=2 Tax=Fimbriiglobus ruber TaxID=1908690 RepID=A0A225DIE0_9BACT|nr:Outer membrane protein, OmpA/MotB family [Fimbriiglobus ruber]